MTQTLLKVEIAGREAALPAAIVQSVIEPSAMAQVPGAPSHIVGLSALRSQAMTVIDPAISIGVGTIERGEETRAVVIEIDRHLYAILVDRADDVTQTLGDIEPAPGHLSARWRNATTGIVETEAGPLLMLDHEALVNGPAKATKAA